MYIIYNIHVILYIVHLTYIAYMSKHAFPNLVALLLLGKSVWRHHMWFQKPKLGPPFWIVVSSQRNTRFQRHLLGSFQAIFEAGSHSCGCWRQDKTKEQIRSSKRCGRSFPSLPATGIGFLRNSETKTQGIANRENSTI